MGKGLEASDCEGHSKIHGNGGISAQVQASERCAKSPKYDAGHTRISNHRAAFDILADPTVIVKPKWVTTSIRRVCTRLPPGWQPHSAQVKRATVGQPRTFHVLGARPLKCSPRSCRAIAKSRHSTALTWAPSPMASNGGMWTNRTGMSSFLAAFKEL